MKLRKLLPRAAGMPELVNWGDDHLYFEAEVLILPDTTFFGWRLFIEEDRDGNILAESFLCKNMEQWGWQDETESQVPNEIQRILQMELDRFKGILSDRFGADFREWESDETKKLFYG